MSAHELKTETFDLLLAKANEKGSSPLPPFITVITPFKNEELYLQETIESVITQTYSNWEYLLIDDGSTDKSTQIAKEYAEKYKGKIFYLEHPAHANRGVCASRNVGIKNAKGEFVALLDGDDMWLPRKLEMQVELIKKYPRADMFCEATFYMNKGQNPKVENVEVAVGVTNDKMYAPPLLVLGLYPLGKGDAPCMNSIVITTEMVRALGGFEETFVGSNTLYEDQAFLFKIYYHANVYVSSLCNNYYRQRPDSSMHKLLAKGNYRAGRIYFLTWLGKYLREQYVQYPTVNALFKKSNLSYNYPRIYKYTYGVFSKTSRQQQKRG